jgi:hypothetical protein
MFETSFLFSRKASRSNETYTPDCAANVVIIVLSGNCFAQLQVKTANGIVEGTLDNGVRTFKGLPYGAPPVGNLRWQPPQR